MLYARPYGITSESMIGRRSAVPRSSHHQADVERDGDRDEKTCRLIEPRMEERNSTARGIPSHDHCFAPNVPR